MQQNCDQSRAAPAFSPVWPGPSGPFREWACALLLLAPCAVASCPPALLLLSLRGALASHGALAGARTATCSQIGDGTSCMFDGVQHRTGGEFNSVSAPGRTGRKTHCKERERGGTAFFAGWARLQCSRLSRSGVLQSLSWCALFLEAQCDHAECESISHQPVQLPPEFWVWQGTLPAPAALATEAVVVSSPNNDVAQRCPEDPSG